MGSLYRSEEMSLCQLFLQSEGAYSCVAELGELALVQFRDLNPDVNAFQRKFVNEVRRCDEMERKLRFLENEIRKEGMTILDHGDYPEAPEQRELADMETLLEQIEEEMKEVKGNADALERNRLDLTEYGWVLQVVNTFFEQDGKLLEDVYGALVAGDDIQLVDDAQARAERRTKQLEYITGAIPQPRIPAFERVLWRVCRGFAFLKKSQVSEMFEDPVSGEMVRKSVFIIFFQGDQLRGRIEKICSGFRATLYDWPETATQRQELTLGVMTRLEDLRTILTQSRCHRERLLESTARSIRNWSIKVHKTKAIYYTMNLFNLDVTTRCLIAECWCPTQQLRKIQRALQAGSQHGGGSVSHILNVMTTKETPPTYFLTNKFTKVFQTIVDAYGVPSYREINPAPFLIISFPFLFSLMFGDAGHGLIMLLAAAWMIWKEKLYMGKKMENEIWSLLFGGRYIILLMGAFSIYSGFLYNDVFSKSLNIFGSVWGVKRYDSNYYDRFEYISLDPAVRQDYSGVPYPFGMDPVWALATNKITFLNSFKMKISVIFGVLHMLLGVIHGFHNQRFFNRKLNILTECIPELLFLLSIFGYLCVLIFYKWIAFDATTSMSAPSLLINLINMFLLKYDKHPTNPSAALFYPGQKELQILLLLLAAVCAITLLLAQPLLSHLRHKNKTKKSSQGYHESEINPIILADELSNQTAASGHVTPSSPLEGQHENMESSSQSVNQTVASGHVTLDVPSEVSQDGQDIEEFDLGEAFIHQAIHTIEYCLGCVSHTASYLRLWALSLAHAELSEVLWNMVMRSGLKVSNVYLGPVAVCGLFAAWSVFTVAVLLLMEGLSAFLHTLRLHWVEYQSKFYKGEGYIFQPFSFSITDDRVQEESVAELVV